MNPIQLEIQAFGPFRKAQTINFENLAKAGLFLITGDTGAGKSTILDAIMFALYDESSGDERGKFEEMRCLQSLQNEDSYVKFTFEADGRAYRFERYREYKRKNFVDRCAALIRNSEGAFEPLFENPRKELLRKKAEELTGMNADQFRQVIILPQGKFEKFLIGDSREKGEILEKIFGCERWDAYANRFYDLVKARRDASDAEKKSIDEALRREGCSDTVALSERVGQLKKEIEDAKAAFENSDHASRTKAVEARRKLIDRFAELRRIEGDAKTLEDQRQEIDAARSEQLRAERAEILRSPLDDRRRALDDFADKRSAAENARQNVAQAAESFASAQRALAELNQKKAARDEAGERKIILESKREIYNEIDALRIAADTAERNAQTGAENKAAAERELSGCKTCLDMCFTDWKNARDAHSEAVIRYMRNISGALAEKLAENEPCPVCGSTHHPAPASHSEEQVGEAQLSRLRNSEKQAEASWKRMDAAYRQKEALYKSAQNDFAEAEKKRAEAAANYRKAREGLIEEIADKAALESEILRLETYILSFDRALEKAFNDAKQAENRRTSAETNAKIAEQARADAQTTVAQAESLLEAKLIEQGFQTAEEAAGALMEVQELTALIARIAAYDEQLRANQENREALESALKDIIEPDPSEIEREAQALKAENDAYQNAMGAKNTEFRRLSALYAELDERKRAHERKAPQAVTDFEFAKKVKGDTGMGLKRYVLSIYFDSVIAAANRMLQSVHNGRYTLFRSDDNGDGRTKTGLDLYLHDRYAPEDKDVRSVKTLSGGEKFLVSLALSIGLSANARSRGLRLDALFIDEGFGTLDESSIDDALEVLCEVQRSNGIVGVISHVKLLEDSIPAKLHVQKGKYPEGSRIIESIG